MSRVQAVLVLAQSLPLLATNTLLGAAADVVGAPPSSSPAEPRSRSPRARRWPPALTARARPR